MTVLVWDLLDGSPAGNPFTGHTSEVTSVAVTGVEGWPIAITCGGWDGTVRSWDLAEAEQRQIGAPVTGHRGQVMQLAVLEHADHRFAISGSLDWTVRAWDLRTNRPTLEPLPVQHASALAIAEVHGDPVAVVCGIGSTELWNLRTGRHGPLRLPTAGLGGYFGSAAVDLRDGRPIVVLAGTYGDLYELDLAELRLLDQPLPTQAPVNALTLFIRDGRSIAVTATMEAGEEQARIRLWDLIDRRAIGELEPVPAPPTAFYPLLATVDLDGHPAVISVGPQETLRVWDATEERLVREVPTRAKLLYSIAAGTRRGRPVAFTVGGDRTLRTWDLRTGTLIDELWLPGTCDSLALGEQGSSVMAVDDDVIVLDTGVEQARDDI